ncbi:uncharacterized protein EAE97_011085 [Botrytis byssoidea]|uniref:NACHT-NTPase and P-loop NTPases N-terminal domain-containing protein n=1 Tax=Botrytis byssoidea TaxID=139641 RepID=A0A9P5I1C8_9HELO|nr:uncharacterized protein EAE97_011085 [Botrytis byssoidea]KAF7922343.1 hypothetical protein EAE97_011085 [Botrytis byssoidea]
MSFGFGIGDILAVIELAKKIRKDFVDAPSQFNDISLEVRSLSIVLQDIEDEFSLPDLNAEQKSELKEIIFGCRDVLEKLQQTLSTYGEFKSDSRGCKAKRIWKRFHWEPDDMKNSADQFHERQDDRELNKKSLAILNWLTPINHASQQHDYITQRQVDTGQWLLDSPVFIEWVNSDKQKLFCPELMNRFRNDKDVGIAYLYCNFRRQHDQKIDDLLLSLPKQLSGYQPLMPGAVKDMFDLHSRRQTRPSTEEVSSTLKSIINSYSKVFIVVDALDECQMADGCRMKFLSEVFHLHETCQLSLFATSRYIPDIEKRFDSSMRLEIRASDKDVERYLDGRISQLPGYVRQSTDLQNEIKIGIIKAVDGMFLLARLNFDSLRGKKSPKAMRKALNSLPTGFDAYRDAYKDAMERIEGQLDDERDLAKQVLSWIICAKRPLTTAELQEAIAVEIDETELDQENFTEINTMISVCAGLVTVDEESKIIRLVHYTTQEYFERTRDDWFPNAETFIATICVTYLSFETFNACSYSIYRDPAERARSDNFSSYAARFWGLHAGKASISEKTLEHALLRFLEDQAKVNTSWQLIDSGDLPELYVGQGSRPEFSTFSLNQFISRGKTAMHITAFFGIENVLQLLLSTGKFEVDSIDNVVKLLLDTGKADVNIKDDMGRTPLSRAAASGNENVVKLLLDIDEVDVTSEDQFHQTPFLYAASKGYEKVVKLLLGTGKVDVNFKDSGGQTPFYWAAEKGHEKVVRLLLDIDEVEIDTIGPLDTTPLLGAVRNGCESIVKRLLNTGAVNINRINYEHRTPITYAAERGFNSIVKLFLNTNSVDVNVVDSYHRTPISYAAQFGSESIVKLLLDTGKIEIGYHDDRGLTPFSYACVERSEGIMKLLLDTGKVDINHKDKNGMTPFWLAAFAGCEAVVKRILSTNKIDLKCQMDCWLCPENEWWYHDEKAKFLVKIYANMKMDIPLVVEESIRKRLPEILKGT